MPSTGFRVLCEGLGFIEGPIWRSDGTMFVTSMTNGVMYSVSEDGVRVAAMTGGGPNGAAEGAGDVVFVAQSGAAQVGLKSPEMTGGVQVVRSASAEVAWVTRDPVVPNDLCLGPDGCLYVTDPTWRPERDDGRIWRVDVQSGEAELLGSVPWYPNGIGFGHDDALYVASTGEQRILRVELNGSRLGAAETVVQMDRGMPDGFAFDVDGHIIVAAITARDDEPGSIQVWDLAGGKEVEVIQPVTDRFVTNVALSGNKLAVCASSTGRVLLFEDWPSAGLPLYPFRKSLLAAS